VPTLVEALGDPSLSQTAGFALRRFGQHAASSLTPLLINEKTEFKLRHDVADVLQHIGWSAGSLQEKTWFNVANGKYEAAASLGKAAIEPLFTALMGGYPDSGLILRSILKVDSSSATRKRISDAQVQLYLANVKDYRQIKGIADAILGFDGSAAAKELIAARFLECADQVTDKYAAHFLRVQAQELQTNARWDKTKRATPQELAQNLEKWEASGLPLTWIGALNGHWEDSEQDFKSLLETLVITPYWPIDATAAKDLLARLTSDWRKDPLNDAIYVVCEWRHAKRDPAMTERALDRIKTYSGGVGISRLLQLFQDTSGMSVFWRPIAAAVAQLGRKDLLLSRLEVSDKKYGSGLRHNYWHEVIRTARPLVDAKCYPEAVVLAVKYLKEGFSDSESGAILKDAMPGAVERLDTSVLTAVTGLRDIVVSGEDLSGRKETDWIDLSSIRALAVEELRRRGQSATAGR
jgi:hypothetical protein